MDNKPQRKSPRLPEYDYSTPGGYFVTICTYQRAHLFGEIVNQEMHLNDLGQLAAEQWLQIPTFYAAVNTEVYVVMPNHVHGILWIQEKQDRPTLGTVVGSFKAGVTRGARRLQLYADPIWQARYHDHIIRDEASLNYIRDYVVHNPQRWQKDIFNQT